MSLLRSSLRPHRYRPLLLTPAERLSLRESFFARLHEPLARWRRGELPHYTLAAVYWVELLKLWRPRHWHSGRMPGVELNALPSVDAAALIPLTMRLRSSPAAAQKAFALWVLHPKWIQVREDIPTSEELLNEQCEGRRVVTLVTDPQAFLGEVNGRDPLSFLLHDLVHAYHFFVSEEQKLAQMRFYREVRDELRRDAQLRSRLKSDSEFAEKFEYLIADMNTHPAHLRAYYAHLRQAYGLAEDSRLSK